VLDFANPGLPFLFIMFQRNSRLGYQVKQPPRL